MMKMMIKCQLKCWASTGFHFGAGVGEALCSAISQSIINNKKEATCGVCTVPVPSIEEVVQPRHVWDPRASQTQHTPSRSFVFGNKHTETYENTLLDQLIVCVSKQWYLCKRSVNQHNNIHTHLCSSSGLLIRLKRMWRSWSLSLGSG